MNVMEPKQAARLARAKHEPIEVEPGSWALEGPVADLRALPYLQGYFSHDKGVPFDGGDVADARRALMRATLDVLTLMLDDSHATLLIRGCPRYDTAPLRRQHNVLKGDSQLWIPDILGIALFSPAVVETTSPIFFQWPPAFPQECDAATVRAALKNKSTHFPLGDAFVAIDGWMSMFGVRPPASLTLTIGGADYVRAYPEARLTLHPAGSGRRFTVSGVRVLRSPDDEQGHVFSVKATVPDRYSQFMTGLGAAEDEPAVYELTPGPVRLYSYSNTGLVSTYVPSSASAATQAAHTVITEFVRIAALRMLVAVPRKGLKKAKPLPPRFSGALASESFIVASYEDGLKLPDELEEAKQVQHDMEEVRRAPRTHPEPVFPASIQQRLDAVYLSQVFLELPLEPPERDVIDRDAKTGVQMAFAWVPAAATISQPDVLESPHFYETTSMNDGVRYLRVKVMLAVLKSAQGAR